MCKLWATLLVDRSNCTLFVYWLDFLFLFIYFCYVGDLNPSTLTHIPIFLTSCWSPGWGIDFKNWLCLCFYLYEEKKMTLGFFSSTVAPDFLQDHWQGTTLSASLPAWTHFSEPGLRPTGIGRPARAESCTVGPIHSLLLPIKRGGKGNMGSSLSSILGFFLFIFVTPC